MSRVNFFGLAALAMVFLAADARAVAPPSPCDTPRAHGPDVDASAVFPVELAPYGRVCFVARKVPVAAHAETNYLQFELLRGGAVPAVTLPWPERYLWSGGCRIRAVSFPRLDKGPQRSILVLGRCTTASDELDQALIYRGGPEGFKLDTPLSIDATGFDTVAKAEAWIRKQGRRR